MPTPAPPPREPVFEPVNQAAEIRPVESEVADYYQTLIEAYNSGQDLAEAVATDAARRAEERAQRDAADRAARVPRTSRQIDPAGFGRTRASEPEAAPKSDAEQKQKRKPSR